MIPSDRRVVRVDEFGAPSVLSTRVEGMPDLGADQVLIKVSAVGVNFADTMVRRGEYRRNQKLPDIPGMEVAGTVVHSPPDSGLLPGTTVAAFMESGGGYTDYAIAPLALVYPVSADLAGVDIAAAFLQGITAWYTVNRFGRAREGDVVLVSGASGGLGGAAVQIARNAGARVIGTASSPSKRAYAESLGCFATLDPALTEFTQEVLTLTDGHGADIVIDGVGGDLFPRLLASLATNGRFVVVGSASQQAAMLDVRHLLPRGQSVMGFVVRNVMDLDPCEPRLALAEVLACVQAGTLILPRTVMPLEDAARAHELLESRQAQGKILLVP